MPPRDAPLSDGPRAVRLSRLPLSVAEVESVARRWTPVELTESALAALATGRSRLEARLGDQRPHYGVNTGFGSLARQRVEHQDLLDLQRNLVRSHAAGVGEPLRTEVVRASMLLLAASLCRGRSGVRAAVPQQLARLLNEGLTPIVPEIGSVGASGDLAPLAHIALTLIGEGEVTTRAGQRMPTAEALAQISLPPVTLESKEGLALINGTHLMAAEGALLCADFDRVFDAAITAAAMSIEAYRGTDGPLDPRAHEVRGHAGGRRVASLLRARLHGSEILSSHKQGDPRVQDPYSLRCVPYVLGAAWDLSRDVHRSVRRELSAVTDNPLVFESSTETESEIVSAGNFHGMPIALPLDTLALAIAHVAGMSERRTYLLLAAQDPESKLSPYLTPKPGVQSGLMIAQYTAAACCNEIVQLASPASVINLSTCAGVEDYNSFGPRSAAKARRALSLTERVVAIELLCAAQGIDTHRPLRTGAPLERAHTLIRARSPRLEDDRSISADIEEIAELVRSGDLSGSDADG
ncbi:MAG: histidine ammonia-lyase [Planctomycetota bacterium]